MTKIISQICLVKTVTKMVIKVAIFAFRWLKSCFGKPWRYGTLSIYVGHANDSFYFLIYVVNSCLHEGKQLLPRFKCWFLHSCKLWLQSYTKDLPFYNQFPNSSCPNCPKSFALLLHLRFINLSILQVFLEWQPCHSSEMVLCSSRAIYLGFCQW